jgi:hypothetical protein
VEKDIRLAAEGRGYDNDLGIALSEAIKRTDQLAYLLRDLHGRKGVIKTGLAKSWLPIAELVELRKKLKTGERFTLDDPAVVEITANQAELLKREQDILSQLADIKAQMEKQVGEYRRPVATSPSTVITAPSNGWLERFKTVTFEESGQPFSTVRTTNRQQKAAIQVLKAIAQDQKRILLAMPTGAGKSIIASQLIWTLFQANWNLREPASRRPRILVMASHNILVDQAYNLSFGIPGNEATRITIRDFQRTDSVPTSGSVFYTNFKTLTDSTILTVDDLGANVRPNYLEYHSDFFDLIVIDDCHQGGSYEVLDYFSSSVQVGLTATPDEDSKTHFGDPVYDLSLADLRPVDTMWGLTEEQPRPMTNAVAYVLRDGRPRSVFEIAKEGWNITGGRDSRSYKSLRPKITKALRRAYRENNDIEQPRRGVYSSRHYEDPSDAINDAFDRGWIVDVRPFHVTVNNISMGHKPPEPSLYVPDELRPDWDYWCRANTEWTADCEAVEESGGYGMLPAARIQRMKSATLFDKFELCLRLSPGQGTPGYYKRALRVWQFPEFSSRSHAGMKRLIAGHGPPWAEKGIESVLSWIVLNVAARYGFHWDLGETPEGHDRGYFGFSEGEAVASIAEKLKTNLWASYGLDLNSIRITTRHDPSHWNEVIAKDEEAKKYTLDHDREFHLLSGDLTKTLSDISGQALSVQPGSGHLINEKQKSVLNESFVVDPVAVPIIAVDLGLIYKNGSKFEFSNEGKSSEQRELLLHSLKDLRKSEREVETRNHPVLDSGVHDLLIKHPELNDEILSIIQLYAAKARTRPAHPKKSIRIPRTGSDAILNGYRSRFNNYNPLMPFTNPSGTVVKP